MIKQRSECGDTEGPPAARTCNQTDKLDQTKPNSSPPDTSRQERCTVLLHEPPDREAIEAMEDRASSSKDQQGSGMSSKLSVTSIASGESASFSFSADSLGSYIIELDCPSSIFHCGRKLKIETHPIHPDN